MAHEEAPGPVRLVEDFVNTLDLRPRREELDSPAALAGWLAERRLIEPSAELDAADLERALGFRETLRRLVEANLGKPLYPVDVAALNQAGAAARLRVRFHAGGARLEPEASGLDGAIGRLLAVVQAAMADGTWERMKACAADDCRWVFFDHTKNRSGTWCSMRSCGNRAKVKAYRERRKGG